MFRLSLSHLASSAALLCAALCAPAHAAPAPVTPEEAREIATEAYLYAYPLVLMDITRKVGTNAAGTASQIGMHAPLNQFAHVPVFPDAEFTEVVRPNADTLYSVLWFEVSKEPLVIDVPDSKGRYYLLPLLDMWSDVFASPGSRTSGNGAQRFAIVGPDWKGKLPDGLAVYRSPTPGGWVIGRTQTNGSADYAAVRQFQAGITATPLSGKRVAGSFDPAVNAIVPVRAVAAMDAASFFARFAQLAGAVPPHAHDYPILDRMARIGLAPGKAFDLTRLPAELQAAFEGAAARARQKIVYDMQTIGKPANGWRVVLNPIGTYGTDYLRRATIAFAGLGANTVEDATYPFAFTDADGKPFDSGARYVIHFDKAQLPPVRAFWSLSMYNDKQFFAANPIGRFAIGDRDPLVYNADGSLDLLIQRDAPPAAQQANWLPAPGAGTFSMNLRLYWPKPVVLDGSWTPPVVRRLP